MLLTSSKAKLTNKVIISVGNEIITNYDLDREIKYLNVITVGRIGGLDNQESKKIAIDSLIKDKIKITALSNLKKIIIKDELLNNQILRSSQNIGFRSIDDFKAYLNFAEYELDEFKKKILLELKWNQLVYQFYKNQIIIDKEKIDKKLKTLIAGKKKNVEYLIYEIFIENSSWIIFRPSWGGGNFSRIPQNAPKSTRNPPKTEGPACENRLFTLCF